MIKEQETPNMEGQKHDGLSAMPCGYAGHD